jgi:hypothetical protein
MFTIISNSTRIISPQTKGITNYFRPVEGKLKMQQHPCPTYNINYKCIALRDDKTDQRWGTKVKTCVHKNVRIVIIVFLNSITTI